MIVLVIVLVDPPALLPALFLDVMMRSALALGYSYKLGADSYGIVRYKKVYGMSTYSGHIDGPPINDTKDHNTYDGPTVIKTIANATQVGVGADKYALGFKGGWPWCSNSSVTSTCVFDATGKATVKYVRDTLGVKHASQWVNEPTSQGAWDAYGYFLHGDA